MTAMGSTNPSPEEIQELVDAALWQEYGPALAAIDADDSWRRYQVDYPPARVGRFAIETYDMPADDRSRVRRAYREGTARDTGHGTFRRLVEYTPAAGPDDEWPGKARLWMSDTRAEIREHAPFFNRLDQATAHRAAAGTNRRLRVLVNGLGLGVVVHGALTWPQVAHVDVVELNPDVAALIGQFLDPARVTVHVADAYTITWPAGTRFDLVWHDIWPQISDLNLPGMRALGHKYRRLATWQGYWQRAGCEQMGRLLRRAKAGHIRGPEAAAIRAGKFPVSRDQGDLP